MYNISLFASDNILALSKYSIPLNEKEAKIGEYNV